VEFSVSPARGLDFIFGASYIDSEVDFTSASTRVLFASPVYNKSRP